MRKIKEFKLFALGLRAQCGNDKQILYRYKIRLINAKGIGDADNPGEEA